MSENDGNDIPPHLMSAIETAKNFEKQGLWEDAAREHEIIAENSGNPELALSALSYAYVCYAKAGKADEAERIWDAVKEIRPISRLLLASQYLQAGKPEVAEILCRKTVEKEPENRANALLLLGTIQLQTQNRPGALESFEQAIQATPESVELRAQLAEIHESIGEYERAARLHRELGELKEEWSQAALSRTYACYLTAGNTEKSDELWGRIRAEKGPEWMDIAEEYARMGREQITETLIAKAASTGAAPDKARTYACRLTLHKRQGDRERARQIVEDARKEGIELPGSFFSVEVLAGYLNDEGWPFHLDQQNSLLVTGWQGPHGPRRLWVSVDEAEGQVQFVVREYLQCADEERRSPLASALLGLNARTMLSQFGMDEKSGEVQMAVGVLFGREGLSSETCLHCLKALVETDRVYYPLLREMCDADLSLQAFWNRLPE